jgi:hypothetical protein
MEGIRRAAGTEKCRGAARESWRNPLIRQRRIEGIRRAIRTPKTRRKRFEGALRARPKKRELMLRQWREHRQKLLARMRRPEYRKKRSELALAQWADPVFHEKMLARFRSPEARRRESLGVRRYIQEHPEARRQRSEAMRTVWRNPVCRSRRVRSLRAVWSAARAAARACGGRGGDPRRFLRGWRCGGNREGYSGDGTGVELLPVAGFGGNDVADAAAGVGNVAGVARDDVEMELGHGLAGGGAVVEAEVEGIGRGGEV